MRASVYTHTNTLTGEVFYAGSIGVHPRELRPSMRGALWGRYFYEVLGGDTSAIEVKATPMPDVGEALAAEWAPIRQHLPVANPATALVKEWEHLGELVDKR